MATEDSDKGSESRQLEKYLTELAECEIELDKAENDANIYRLKKTGTIYTKRRAILCQIPQFWYIVLAETDEFLDFIRNEDLKYLEYIKDIYVQHKVVETGELKDTKDFSITIAFEDLENLPPLIAEQSVTKHFETRVEQGEEKLYSSPVEILWPEELDSINPHLIKEKAGKTELSPEQKKNYRLGMRSFFSWFSWTGKKPGKEFRSGAEVARLIVDDLYPYAVKYYTEALPGNESGEEDSSEGEELDLSDDDEEAEDDEEEEKPVSLTSDLESRKRRNSNEQTSGKRQK